LDKADEMNKGLLPYVLAAATCLLLFLMSCGSENKKQKDLAAHRAATPGGKRLDCLPGDTILDVRNALKYVVLDSFFAPELRVEGTDTLLDYRFDCSAPEGLVPSLYSFYDGKFCLIVGHAFSYREFIIAYRENDHVKLKRYETALLADMKRDLVVYRNYDKRTSIIFRNFITDSARTRELPKSFLHKNITQTHLEGNRLRLIFDDGSKADLSVDR
jgi:hypothetical protein